jgi:uncharacterized protein (UPF0276 family)
MKSSMSSAWPTSDNLPDLGVGIVFSTAIEPLLTKEPYLVDVIEVEPQTLWTQDVGETYRARDEEALSHLLALPGQKLVHSVGTPAGGTVRPELAELERLNHWAERLQSPWWSDHLSFNRTPEFSTGFFLPPLQTLESVEVLSAGIRQLKSGIPRPLALETGVNYLKPRPGEIPDGEFVARTVEAADCGILLDLHNIFTNARNGRQPVEDYLSQLPLERVWEMHLAGGMWQDGYWLDAHSGPMPDDLFSLAEKVVPRLPRLRAIMFEIYPSFVPIVGLDAIRDDIAKLRSLWALRRPMRSIVSSVLERSPRSKTASISASEWERVLACAVTGQETDTGWQQELGSDPSIRLVRGLIHEFRASMISRVLPLTMRLLMLMISPAMLRTLLRDFESRCTPKMYASREAKAFSRYLVELNLQVPRLREVLAFESAVVATLEDGVTRVVPFGFEPMPLLRAIADGRLPQEPPAVGNFEIEVTGEGFRNEGGMTG